MEWNLLCQNNSLAGLLGSGRGDYKITKESHQPSIFSRDTGFNKLEKVQVFVVNMVNELSKMIVSTPQKVEIKNFHGIG